MSTPINKELRDDCLLFLSGLLTSRGVRKYLNINNFGYSQVERDIVDGIIRIVEDSKQSSDEAYNESEDGLPKGFWEGYGSDTKYLSDGRDHFDGV